MYGHQSYTFSDVSRQDWLGVQMKLYQHFAKVKFTKSGVSFNSSTNFETLRSLFNNIGLTNVDQRFKRSSVGYGTREPLYVTSITRWRVHLPRSGDWPAVDRRFTTREEAIEYRDQVMAARQAGTPAEAVAAAAAEIAAVEAAVAVAAAS